MSGSHFRVWRLLSAVILLCVALVISVRPAMALKPQVTGWLERIHVEGIEPRLPAKFDSGALTSSIHGTNKIFFDKNDERWLRFDFHWYKKSSDEWFGPFTIEAPLKRKVLIKDHEDDSRKRPVVVLRFALDGQCHEAEFSVVDRSGFNYPVLMGRRWLAGRVLIDPRKTFTDSAKGLNVNKICEPVKKKSSDSNLKNKSKDKSETKDTLKTKNNSVTNNKLETKNKSESKDKSISQTSSSAVDPQDSPAQSTSSQ